MIKQNKLIAYLEEMFPTKTAAPWDQVGFQIAESFNNVELEDLEKILIVLDFNSDALDYAITNDIKFVITRHPFIFNKIEDELESPSKKNIYEVVSEMGIQVFSIHTNYDCSNHQMMSKILAFDIPEITSFERFGNDSYAYKLQLSPDTKLETLINRFLNLLNLKHFNTTKHTNLKTKVSEVYFATGAAASLLSTHSLKDTSFITGEAKWHDFIYAQDNNINLVTLGHYMENYFVNDISQLLISEFGDEIQVHVFDIGDQINYY